MDQAEKYLIPTEDDMTSDEAEARISAQKRADFWRNDGVFANEGTYAKALQEGLEEIGHDATE